MLDGYKRNINYLRISLTDRCNLRCVYCMPAEGVEQVAHGEILTLEEIYQVVKAATLLGIRKVRLTGGEPLVRLGVTDLIKRIKETTSIDDISITTNGILLKKMGKDLQQAGLNRVNISLDSLEQETFHKITRHDALHQVLAGIDEALSLGLHPVKINTVVIRGVNDHEVLDFARWTTKEPVHIRFIELMPIGTSNPWAGDCYIPAEEIINNINNKLGTLTEEHKLAGSGPAKYFRLPGAPGTIGFITAISEHFCQQCNRLRLTANGKLRPCLYDNREIDIKAALRAGSTPEQLAEVIGQAISLKPDRHHMQQGWQDQRTMSQIGG